VHRIALYAAQSLNLGTVVIKRDILYLKCLVVYVANIAMYFFFTMLYIIDSVLFIVKLIKLLFFRLFCYRIIDSGEIEIFISS